MTLARLRSERREEALRHGIPPRDVDLLLSDLVGRPLAWLVAHGDETIDPAPLDALLERRYRGEPVQYIRGRSEFYGREFYVDDRVLIPRPETEILVEAAIARAPRGARIADIGTGSGCIALTLALERADLHVCGIDRSLDALAVAVRNRERLGSPAALMAGDFLSAIRDVDFIVSNPPYIPEGDVAALDPGVRDYEPRMALTPGPRGIEAIERILAMAGRARVLLEIGFGQERLVRETAAAQRFEVETILNDLAGIPRVVVLSSAW